MIVGLDIGGTKCAVATWSAETGLREVTRFPTRDPETTLGQLEECLARLAFDESTRIGIACGGPLDVRSGVILSPPNLPGWDRIAIVERLSKRWKCPVQLMNDANANALAEWKFGAGQGAQLMVYLTAGTGMGAGIVIHGKVLEGVNGNAGEVGHLRLAPSGPRGYHKAGSFEGFCSGGGIPAVVEFLAGASRPPDVAAWRAAHPTTEKIAQAARGGDLVAQAVFAEVGRRLGEALATIIDVLNPDRIVIGSLFVRCRDLLEDQMNQALRREALAASLVACTIVPAGLGEQTGLYGAVCAGMESPGEL